jgi:hypothetical protein
MSGFHAKTTVAPILVLMRLCPFDKSDLVE